MGGMEGGRMTEEEEESKQQGDMVSTATELPNHLLSLVVERLCFPDLFRFGCVCKPWRSVCDPLQFRYHLPFLIIPFNKKNEDTPSFSTAYDHTGIIGFYSLVDAKIYTAELPQLSNRRICGSFPGGWLMTVHENSQVQLFNPLMSIGTLSSLIHLPPLTKFPHMVRTFQRREDNKDALFYESNKLDTCHTFCRSSEFTRDTYIHKVAVSSPFITKGTIIMAIESFDWALAFYRVGAHQQVWTPVTTLASQVCFTDVTFYQGKFFGVRSNGSVAAVHGLEQEEDDDGDSPSVVEVISGIPRTLANNYYIVESSGDLLVVLRRLKFHSDLSNDTLLSCPYQTVSFKVLKLEFGTPNRWVEVDSLGDRSLFLGHNSSFSASSTALSGCKPNHIYFTDDCTRGTYSRKFGGHDFGIFSLQHGTIEKYLYPSDNLLVTPFPIWFAPYLPS